jgi:hypothetical protein
MGTPDLDLIDLVIRVLVDQRVQARPKQSFGLWPGGGVRCQPASFLSPAPSPLPPYSLIDTSGVGFNGMGCLLHFPLRVETTLFILF